MPKGPEIFDECWDTEILQSEEKKKYYVCMLKKMKLLGLANELNKLRLYESSIKDKSLPIPLYGETIGFMQVSFEINLSKQYKNPTFLHFHS